MLLEQGETLLPDAFVLQMFIDRLSFNLTSERI